MFDNLPENTSITTSYYKEDIIIVSLKVTCSHHDIAAKLLYWYETTMMNH
jgi:hypothetical protein